MRRWLLLPLLGLLLLGNVAPAQADWLARFWHEFCHDAYRNKIWPQPWIGPDRDAVVAPMQVMVANGWRRQNTINGHHFKEGTNELTEAGRFRVKWIVNSAPEAYRTIFVNRDDDPETTAARVAAVQEAAARYSYDGQVPMVVEVVDLHEGWPAGYIDLIDRKFRDSTPDPRLPEPMGDEVN